jgi:hypothetical protein
LEPDKNFKKKPLLAEVDGLRKRALSSRETPEGFKPVRKVGKPPKV